MHGGREGFSPWGRVVFVVHSLSAASVVAFLSALSAVLPSASFVSSFVSSLALSASSVSFLWHQRNGPSWQGEREKRGQSAVSLQSPIETLHELIQSAFMGLLVFPM